MEPDVQKKVAEFFSKYPLRTYGKGQIIIHAGEAPPGVLYIMEGRVSQYDITSSGNEVVVNIFKPGAFFPMSWAINGTTNQYFFEASVKTLYRQAPREDTVQFVRDNPDVLFDLLSRVYRGLDGVLRRTAHLMGGDAKSRLVFELLNAAARFGEPLATGDVGIRLSESDIARHSGLARETVNRMMQELKTAGLVKITAHGIVVSDTRQLEQSLGNTV